MPQDKRLELERRRGELLARSQILRGRIAEDIQPAQRVLSMADRVREGFRWLMANPVYIVPLVALPVIFHPRRAFALAWRAFAGWRIWQRTVKAIQDHS
jgi:hypothetical protein